jgi:cobalt/nickel transport system permease protein
LWAVHLADGAIAEAWLVAGWLGCALLLLRSLRHLHDEDIPRLGLLTAAFFVSSSIHIKLAVLPTSVHLLLNGLVGVLLGPRAPIAIAVGLLLQYLLLAHGGLTTLGLNTCIIAIPALGMAFLERRLRAYLPPFWRGVLVGGGAVAGTVLLNFAVLLLGGKEEWGVLARLVLLAHLPVLVLEAGMLGVILAYLERVKPEMLQPLSPPSAATPSQSKPGQASQQV